MTEYYDSQLSIQRKTENASNTIAMGARPGFHIFFGVIRRKPRPDHIASSKDKRSNVASANFAGRPSTVVSVDFAARPSAVASADFAGRPSVVISAYFAAELTDGYRMKKRAYKLQDFE
ncbi:hypothetical protein TRIUR3_32465 [Triticum urartu]|uniref:Uncharacterized protein n=1 Tax=Triticum urartu TaxID=4572 RepID=M7Z570_TRIUA|nr:hypothetical protein TRIUR3_32465 [Triticum urartu]